MVVQDGLAVVTGRERVVQAVGRDIGPVDPLLEEPVHLPVAVQVQRQDGSVERFVAQCVIQGVVIEFDHGRFAGTVNDAGNAIRFTQTAARTRSLRFACCCADFDCHFTSPLLMKRSATRGFGLCTSQDGCCEIYSVNSELTDSSLLMRRIVSASNSATLS